MPGRCSGAMPVPVSATTNSTCGGVGRALSVTRPPGGVWRSAFPTRLVKTRVMRSGSTQTSAIGPAARTSSATPCCRAACSCAAATHPFFAYVEAVYAHGVVSGYDCGGPGEPCPGLYFRPASEATRGQVTKFVTLAYGGPAR